jgi:hypothetical protein
MRHTRDVDGSSARAVSLDVAQITDVPLLIRGSTVVLALGVEVGAGGSAAVRVVTELAGALAGGLFGGFACCVLPDGPEFCRREEDTELEVERVTGQVRGKRGGVLIHRKECNVTRLRSDSAARECPELGDAMQIILQDPTRPCISYPSEPFRQIISA